MDAKSLATMINVTWNRPIKGTTFTVFFNRPKEVRDFEKEVSKYIKDPRAVEQFKAALKLALHGGKSRTAISYHPEESTKYDAKNDIPQVAFGTSFIKSDEDEQRLRNKAKNSFEVSDII